MTFSYKIWFSKRISKKKIHTIRKYIRNLKYVKTIKMYKISTDINFQSWKCVTWTVVTVSSFKQKIENGPPSLCMININNVSLFVWLCLTWVCPEWLTLILKRQYKIEKTATRKSNQRLPATMKRVNLAWSIWSMAQSNVQIRIFHGFHSNK